MPFDRGAISYSRFALESWKATPLQKLLKALQESSFIDEGEGAGVGWTAGEHLFDAGFTDERMLFHRDVLAAIRIDSDRVPPEVRRAYLLSAMAEEMADADRSSRRRARERALRRCDAEVAEGRWRRRALVPLLIRTHDAVVLAPTKSDAVTTAIRSLIERTLDCTVTPQTSGTLALLIAGQCGREGAAADAEPESFGPVPGATADRSGRPDPAWCEASHPMDFLGNAFVLWAWWRSEQAGQQTDCGTIVLRKSIELACPWDSTGSIVVRSDDPAARSEVRAALRCGKWPRRVGLILSNEGEAWEFTLQADRWEVSGLRLDPPSGIPGTRREAIEVRLASLQSFDQALIALYSEFLRERFGNGWKTARANVVRWMRESEPRITRVAELAE